MVSKVGRKYSYLEKGKKGNSENYKYVTPNEIIKDYSTIRTEY